MNILLKVKSLQFEQHKVFSETTAASRVTKLKGVHGFHYKSNEQHRSSLLSVLLKKRSENERLKMLNSTHDTSVVEFHRTTFLSYSK